MFETEGKLVFISIQHQQTDELNLIHNYYILYFAKQTGEVNEISNKYNKNEFIYIILHYRQTYQIIIAKNIA